MIGQLPLGFFRFAVESFVGALEDVLKSLTDKGDGETNAYRHLQIKVGAKGLLAGDLT